ncbi:MAG: hypothetical protein EHM27_12180 [Deltaproteobacteria bacterium]|nr:MAG: hypothetical protein EHM27_12180 [Deltaproteobacteria bacterium]
MSRCHSIEEPEGGLALEVMARFLAYGVLLTGFPVLMGIDISGSLKTGIPLVGANTPGYDLWGLWRNGKKPSTP